ncbi:MAG: AgmX/PglI C-terminal domain-containing protein [Bacteriovoracaceae bacterium]|nr:AgmX/PglI C-terminal domain-containing protein [Bacteriovoracaceae bacterium]
MNALIASSEGQFVKALPAFEGSRVYGWHKSFGLISEDGAKERIQAAKRKGALARNDEWVCRFQVDWKGGKPVIIPVNDCKIAVEKNNWTVQSANRSWTLSTESMGDIAAPSKTSEENKTEKYLMLLILALFLVLAGLIAFWAPEEVKKEEEIIEPVTVVVKEHKTITVSSQTTPQTVQEAKPVKRAVPQDLGFLGLVGKKDLSKAVGGAQINLKASAGAGKGGSEGSGGEVLSGLGKGVRATTVGNTGVQGLGGVGTKGKGGGLGGYGDVAIASGEGRGISSIAVSQGVGVDGGLDRHVIQATIAKYLNQVRACYEDRLRVNPGLEGTLTMDFEIGGMGRLNFSKVKSSSVGDPQVGSCVATRMMGWEFPKPRGGVNVKVTYPFSLRPVSR